MKDEKGEKINILPPTLVIDIMLSRVPKVINPRVIRILIILDMLIFLPGIAVAILLAFAFGGTEIGPGSYNFVDNYISDLGSARYSPAPWLLDGISMISAIILVPLLIYSKKLADQDIREQTRSPAFLAAGKRGNLAGFCALYVGIVGLFGIGLFSEDRAFGWVHYFFSIVVFTGFAVGASTLGIVGLLNKTYAPKSLNFLMVTFPALATILYGWNLLQEHPPFPKPPLEWLMLLSIFWWILPVGVLLLRMKKTGTIQHYFPETPNTNE